MTMKPSQAEWTKQVHEYLSQLWPFESQKQHMRFSSFIRKTPELFHLALFRATEEKWVILSHEFPGSVRWLLPNAVTLTLTFPLNSTY